MSCALHTRPMPVIPVPSRKNWGCTLDLAPLLRPVVFVGEAALGRDPGLVAAMPLDQLFDVYADPLELANVTSRRFIHLAAALGQALQDRLGPFGALALGLGPFCHGRCLSSPSGFSKCCADRRRLVVQIRKLDIDVGQSLLRFAITGDQGLIRQFVAFSAELNPATFDVRDLAA
jgi:hypothetical protein